MSERERRERIMADALSHIAYGMWEEGPPLKRSSLRFIARDALQECEKSKRIEEEAARIWKVVAGDSP